MTGLFPRTPEEAHEHLERVLENERKMRKLMRSQKPDEYPYWTKRIGEIDKALGALEVLKPVAEVRTRICDEGRWRSCWMTRTTEEVVHNVQGEDK